MCEKKVALLTHSYIRFEIHSLPVPVSWGYDKFLQVVHLQGQKKSLKQRENSFFCDHFYTEDFKNGCASSRYMTATFLLQISRSLWVKQPPFLHGEIFLVSSPNQLINCLTPLLQTTSFSRIYWLALNLAAKATCGVQGTDVCWPLKWPVVVKGLSIETVSVCPALKSRQISHK